MDAPTPVQVRDARYRALADPVRRRLLRLLDESESPQDVQGLSTAVGLHPNTVRGHLEVLERAGLVSRSTFRRDTPGRPRVVYAAVPDPDEAVMGGYRLLAAMLASGFHEATTDAAGAARAAGAAWGRKLMASSPDLDPDPVTRLTGMLRAYGFDPRPGPGDDASTVDLLDCPFRDLAREHPEVVCSLHLGLMQGAAEEMGGLDVESLEPFVAPSLCRALLRRSA